MYKKVPLDIYAKNHGQINTAKAIGVTQGAISKALKSKRKIFIFEGSGKVFAEEIRPFPSLESAELAERQEAKNE